jgi:Zn-dependent peptidase ImmA (M78 family)
MVSAVESGRRPFLGTLEPLGYSDARLTLPTMSEPMHRQRASTGAAAKKRAKELLRLAGEVFAELRYRTPKAPSLGLERQPALSGFSVQQLEELAVEVRCELDHEESGPIQNLTAAVERAGVCLIPIVGLTGVDGISAWVNDIPVIGVAPNVPGDRFRFSLSHELAHLLFHVKRTELTESEANRFAGALLFPQSEFDEAMRERPTLKDFIGLKSSWGMAVSALVYRAHELDHIDDTRYRALQIQMSKWHKAEPGRFEPVHGTLFGRLVETNGGTAKVSADLGINRHHLAELSNWTHLRVA